MQKNILTVVGITILFLSTTLAPGIIADFSIELDNSDLVEITVQIYKIDKTYNHTVMLTQEQNEKLGYLINNFEIELDYADDIGEIEVIFKNTAVSLNELGLLPNGINIEDAQCLITGKDQDPRIIKFFERYYSDILPAINSNSATATAKLTH